MACHNPYVAAYSVMAMGEAGQGASENRTWWDVHVNL